MKEKTVKLGVYAAELLEEYRELNDKYERLVKEVSGMELTHLKDDEALVTMALRLVIDKIKSNIEEKEAIKAKEACHDA